MAKRLRPTSRVEQTKAVTDGWAPTERRDLIESLVQDLPVNEIYALAKRAVAELATNHPAEARCDLGVPVSVAVHYCAFEDESYVDPAGWAALAAFVIQFSLDCPDTFPGAIKAVLWRAVRDQHEFVEAAKPTLDKHRKLSTARPNMEKALADDRLFRSGLKLEAIARRNGEPLGTVRQRRTRFLKRQRKQDDTPAV